MVRRSTSGSVWRTSKRPQRTRTTSPPTIAPSVRASPQPQVVALETPTRKETSPIARPATPTTSRRPGLASWTCGTKAKVATRTSSASAGGDPEQGVPVVVLGDPGRQRQADRPADAEGRAHRGDGGAGHCGGVISRISEMPTGMKPIASPCSARPASIGASESDRAQTTRADQQDHGAGHQHALLAEQVGQPARDRHRHRRGEQGDGDDPGGVGRRGVQQPGQLALDRDDQRLGQCGRQATEAEDDDGQRGVRRRGPGAERQGDSLSWDVYGTYVARINQFAPANERDGTRSR